VYDVGVMTGVGCGRSKGEKRICIFCL